MHDGEAVLVKMQIANHRRVEQADRIARRRIAKARMKLLGDRGAAEYRTAFQYTHFLPARREVAGAHQTVVSAADDDGVVGRVRMLCVHSANVNDSPTN